MEVYARARVPTYGRSVLGAPAAFDTVARGTNRVSTFWTAGSSTQASGEVRQEFSVQPRVMAETFESFYRRDYQSLAGLAYTMTGSRWLAEELAQEAMAAAHAEWSTVGKYDDPAAWVRRVLVNKKISAWRKFGSEKRAMNRLRSQRDVVIDDFEEPQSEIWAAVRRLPRRQAQTLSLIHI